MTAPDTHAPIRLLFIIPSLGAGGAERQLCALLRAMDRTRFTVHLAVFYDRGDYDGGELWPEVEGLPGLTIHCMGKRRGLFSHFALARRMVSLVRHIRPQLIHGYLGGNLYALLLSRLVGACYVWGIRRTSADSGKITLKSRLNTKISARLSRLVPLIIFNSRAGRHNHEAMGFRGHRHIVIANGIDVERFHPDGPAGLAWRRQHGLESASPLIGIVGRFHPVKDHDTFLRAMARAVRHHPTLRAVCIGGGSPAGTERLQARARALGIADMVAWTGVSTDMPAAYNALDMLALTSTDEGFPNAVGEAMACGVPCVVTRVGDAEDIVGDAGLVVDVGDAAAVAEAIGTLLDEQPADRAARQERARDRIRARFSTRRLADHTQNALEALVRGDDAKMSRS